MPQLLIGLPLALLSLAVSACSQDSPGRTKESDCVRPGRHGCIVSMYEVVADPDKYLGERVSFIAFYAPALGRPTFFIDKERWILFDTPSAIAVSEMDNNFQSAEESLRYSYVRATGVVERSRVTRMEPHIALRDVSVQIVMKQDEMSRVERALMDDADIGLTDTEYSRSSVGSSEGD